MERHSQPFSSPPYPLTPSFLCMSIVFFSIDYFFISTKHTHLSSPSTSLLTAGNRTSRYLVAAMATFSHVAPAIAPVLPAATGISSKSVKSTVAFVKGLNFYVGLKAHGDAAAAITTLGLPKCTAQSFKLLASSLKSPEKKKNRRGGGSGALSSTCNAAAEIFKIAAIMNGLVLVGVAVGFVLLRIEASLEEAE